MSRPRKASHRQLPVELQHPAVQEDLSLSRTVRARRLRKPGSRHRLRPPRLGRRPFGHAAIENCRRSAEAGISPCSISSAITRNARDLALARRFFGSCAVYCHPRQFGCRRSSVRPFGLHLYSASGSQTEVKSSTNPATGPSPLMLSTDVRSSTEPSGRYISMERFSVSMSHPSCAPFSRYSRIFF